MEDEENKINELVEQFSKEIKKDTNILSKDIIDKIVENSNKNLDEVSNSFNKNEENNNELELYRNIPVTPVESSNIAGISYLSESKILKVRFIGGGEYIYKNVEKLQYDNILNSKSIGKYFINNIKAFPDKYKCIKL